MPQDYYYDSKYDIYDVESKDYESKDYSQTYDSQYSRYSGQYSVSVTTDDISERYPSNNNTSDRSVSLSWRNLSYEINDPKTKKNKKIIQNVSGFVKPGEVMASKYY